MSKQIKVSILGKEYDALISGEISEITIDRWNGDVLQEPANNPRAKSVLRKGKLSLSVEDVLSIEVAGYGGTAKEFQVTSIECGMGNRWIIGLRKWDADLYHIEKSLKVLQDLYNDVLARRGKENMPFVVNQMVNYKGKLWVVESLHDKDVRYNGVIYELKNLLTGERDHILKSGFAEDKEDDNDWED